MTAKEWIAIQEDLNRSYSMQAELIEWRPRLLKVREIMFDPREYRMILAPWWWHWFWWAIVALRRLEAWMFLWDQRFAGRYVDRRMAKWGNAWRPKRSA